MNTCKLYQYDISLHRVSVKCTETAIAKVVAKLRYLHTYFNCKVMHSLAISQIFKRIFFTKLRIKSQKAMESMNPGRLTEIVRRYFGGRFSVAVADRLLGTTELSET